MFVLNSLHICMKIWEIEKEFQAISFFNAYLEGV